MILQLLLQSGCSQVRPRSSAAAWPAVLQCCSNLSQLYIILDNSGHIISDDSPLTRGQGFPHHCHWTEQHHLCIARGEVCCQCWLLHHVFCVLRRLSRFPSPSTFSSYVHVSKELHEQICRKYKLSLKLSWLKFDLVPFKGPHIALTAIL